MTTNFTITEDSDVSGAAFVGDVVPEDVAPRTPLLSLRERRQELTAGLTKEIRVPRWNNPEIYIVFKPASSTRFDQYITRRRERAKTNPDWGVMATCDVICDSCVGVYALRPDDETHYSLRVNDATGTLTQIDQDLAAALGLEGATSQAETCRALFFAEGDISIVANELLRWSGIAGTEADEDF